MRENDANGSSGRFSWRRHCDDRRSRRRLPSDAFEANMTETFLSAKSSWFSESLSKRRDGSRNTMRNDAPAWELRRLSTRHFVEESRHVLQILKLSSYMYISGSCEKFALISRGRHNRKLLLSPNRFRDARAMRCVCVCARVCVFYVMIVLYLLLMLNLYIHC